MAPERLVVLPRAANRAFYDAVVAACHLAGLSPTLVEMPERQVEYALLAVSSGAGMALVPEVVAERYMAPGVRFVPLEGELPAVATAAVTRRESAHLPTQAFLHAVCRAGRPRGIAAENTTTTVASAAA